MSHEGLCPQTPIADLLVRELDDAAVYDMWYDWFCKDTSLVRKGRSLLARIRAIGKSPRFDATKCYAFFKNNCPGAGRLYDDFRICDIDTGDVVFCVTPSCGHTKMAGQSQVWGKNPLTGEFEELVAGSWADVKAFFKERDPAKVLTMIANTAMDNAHREATAENEHRDREARFARHEAEYRADAADREYARAFESFLAR
jgi:hypothetical protein